MDEVCSNQSNVYVNNFGKDVDDVKLHELFQRFGRITSAKVMHDDRGVSRGFGFVQFKNPRAAKKAIEAVNGAKIGSKTLYCGYAQKKAERRAEFYKKYKDVNLCVSNLHENVDEKELHKLFSRYGTVTSVKVQYKNGQSQGYGYVRFENSHTADLAMKALNGKTFQGKEINCTYVQTKAELQGVNLFVKNLHESIDDAKLHDLFSRFGTITSAKVMKESGVSKNFGFVHFSSPEAAARAITEMNGKSVSGKVLYVGLHQKKEDRQAQLAYERIQRLGSRLEEKSRSRSRSVSTDKRPALYMGWHQKKEDRQAQLSDERIQRLRSRHEERTRSRRVSTVGRRALYVGWHLKKEDRQAQLAPERIQRLGSRLEEEARCRSTSTHGRPAFDYWYPPRTAHPGAAYMDYPDIGYH